MNCFAAAKAADHAAVPSYFPDSLCFPLNCAGLAVLATGVDLKNSLCLASNGQAEISAVMGDINDPSIYSSASALLREMGDIDAVACDLHPDLHATRLAAVLSNRLDVPLIPVQHHHAHIAAVIAERGIETPVIGLALDGYGYGADGTAWGGECLYVDVAGFNREGYLKRVAMPGGDAASRQPWRMAVAWLDNVKTSRRLFPGQAVAAVHGLCGSASTPRTSSAGRLFDAASAIVLGKTDASFEGEAAIMLERAAASAADELRLPYQLEQRDDGLELDCSRMTRQLAEAVSARNGDRAMLAAGFHASLAEGFAGMAIRCASDRGVQDVVLAGGCFLNRRLKGRISEHLESAGLRVLSSRQLPHGDGAIALGQTWVALQTLKQEKG